MSFHKYLLKYLLSSLLISASSWQKPREKNDWGKKPTLGRGGGTRAPSPKVISTRQSQDDREKKYRSFRKLGSQPQEIPRVLVAHPLSLWKHDLGGNKKGIRSDRQSAWRTTGGGLWHCTGSSDQDHPHKETQKGKMIVWKGLTNTRKEEKLKAKEKMKDTPIWMQSSKE